MYVRWIIVAADIRCAVSGHRFVLEVRPRSRASDARSQHGDVGVVAEISQWGVGRFLIIAITGRHGLWARLHSGGRHRRLHSARSLHARCRHTRMLWSVLLRQGVTSLGMYDSLLCQHISVTLFCFNCDYTIKQCTKGEAANWAQGLGRASRSRCGVGFGRSANNMVIQCATIKLSYLKSR